MSRRVSRRRALSLAALLPVQKLQPDRFTSFDQVVEEHIRARGIHGASLAVSRDGEILYASGYGWADAAGARSATSNTRYRIASISKPVTAVAILRLVEAGRLKLDAPALPLLDELLEGTPPPVDARWSKITVRHLLQHTAGFDRDASFDPMFRPLQIAEAEGEPPPALPQAIIRYMLKQPLDFKPGARHAYSNFGYSLLGRIVESLTGLPYEEALLRDVLRPAGCGGMRIGATHREGALAREAAYGRVDDEPAVDVWDPEGLRSAPWPYGGFHLEAMDAHGGWVATPSELLRFLAAVEGRGVPPLLQEETLRQIIEPPAPPVARGENGELRETYYGLGWQVRPVSGEGANWWHAGSLPGTWGILVRRWDGLAWALLMNGRSRDEKLPDATIDRALHGAAAAVPGLVPTPPGAPAACLI